MVENGRLNEEELAFLQFYLNEDEKDDYNAVVVKATVLELQSSKQATNEAVSQVKKFIYILNNRNSILHTTPFQTLYDIFMLIFRYISCKVIYR